MRCTRSTGAAAALLVSAPLLAQPVLTHTLWEWEPESEFIPLAATIVRPIDGEILRTRIDLTLHDVPPSFEGTPLNAADIFVQINAIGADPLFPEFPIPLALRAEGGLHMEFSGVGGPMTATITSDALNGPVWISDDPDNSPDWWGFEMGHTRTDIPIAVYGPVTGTVEIDYIPTPGTAPCPCERTGDSPASVDVFDLLAYLGLWFAGDFAANLNDDELVDVFDLLAYLDCWFAADATTCI
jgi:hypothetical protein